jgi:hypothetical protein
VVSRNSVLTGPLLKRGVGLAHLAAQNVHPA